MAIFLPNAAWSNLTYTKNSAGYSNGFTISLEGQAQEAVENGVALTFNCKVARVHRFFFLTWTERAKTHSFILKRHALSSRYVIRMNDDSKPHSFRSLNASMIFLAEQTRGLYNNYRASDHTLEMRLSLSKYQLPGPIRLSAFITDDWDIDTGWIKWHSEA